MADYEMVKRLGNGAFGEVWLTNDRALGVTRAVKFVPDKKITDPTNFYKEPQLLKTLRHPNIVEVEDAGRTKDDMLYIAMEYLSEGSVEDIMQGGIVPVTRAIRIICDVCRGLEYAHNLGFVHRDIKPANILLTQNGMAKISDFGLATKIGDTGAASAQGYISHLAPEVFQENITNSLTDIYAAGMTMYRLVNGDAYLQMNLDEDELEDRIVNGTYPDRKYYRPFISRRLRTIINKAMNTNPDLRYQSARDFRHDLEQLEIKCDWETLVIPNGTVWKSRVKDTEFYAEMQYERRGCYSFTLKKGKVGNPKRLVSSDTRNCISKPNIDRHIHRVLTRISG